MGSSWNRIEKILDEGKSLEEVRNLSVQNCLLELHALSNYQYTRSDRKLQDLLNKLLSRA